MGCFRLGDEIIAVDGVGVKFLSFQEVVSLIKRPTHHARKVISVFRRVVTPLPTIPLNSYYPQTASTVQTSSSVNSTNNSSVSATVATRAENGAMAPAADGEAATKINGVKPATLQVDITEKSLPTDPGGATTAGLASTAACVSQAKGQPGGASVLNSSNMLHPLKNSVSGHAQFQQMQQASFRPAPPTNNTENSNSTSLASIFHIVITSVCDNNRYSPDLPLAHTGA